VLGGGFGRLLALHTGHMGVLWAPVAFYLGIPLLDYLLGEDTSNPRRRR